MRRALPLLASLAIVVTSGLVHGHWTGRWSSSHDLTDAVARLDRVPETVGGWVGRPGILDERTLQAAGLAGSVVRRYENRRGDAVSLLVVCGRPGPVAVHTPEVCYPGAGYEQVGATTKVRVSDSPGAGGEFWAVGFDKPRVAVSEHLTVLYAFSPDGVNWSADASPRLTYAGLTALYKMYVVRVAPEAGESARDGLAAAFAAQLLPELRKAYAGATAH